MSQGDRGISTDFNLFGISERDLSCDDVFGEVNDHRSRSARRGDVKSLPNASRQIRRVLDEIVVFSAGPGDAQNIGFLESVVPNLICGNLSCQHHNRYGIHKGRHYAGNDIGRPWSRCNQANPGFARRPRIAVGGMNGSLFMTHQDVFNSGIIHQLIVEVDDRASRVAEYDFDPLAKQALQYNLCSSPSFQCRPPPCCYVCFAVPDAARHARRTQKSRGISPTASKKKAVGPVATHGLPCFMKLDLLSG